MLPAATVLSGDRNIINTGTLRLWSIVMVSLGTAQRIVKAWDKSV